MVTIIIFSFYFVCVWLLLLLVLHVMRLSPPCSLLLSSVCGKIPSKKAPNKRRKFCLFMENTIIQTIIYLIKDANTEKSNFYLYRKQCLPTIYLSFFFSLSFFTVSVVVCIFLKFSSTDFFFGFFRGNKFAINVEK